MTTISLVRRVPAPRGRDLVDRALAEQETIIWRTRRHWIGLVGPLALLGLSVVPYMLDAAVISGLAGAPALAWLAKRIVEHRVIALAVTDRGRLVLARGTLHAHVRCRPLGDIDGIGVEQSLVGMLLSFGDVLVYDARVGQERIAAVAAPSAFARAAARRIGCADRRPLETA